MNDCVTKTKMDVVERGIWTFVTEQLRKFEPGKCSSEIKDNFDDYLADNPTTDSARDFKLDKFNLLSLLGDPGNYLAASSLDPQESISIYNHIAQAIHVKCDVLDKIIHDAMDGDFLGKEDEATFRCWLDVAIKITNVSGRVQATTSLRLPSYTSKPPIDTVCQLVYHGKGKFSRLFLRDKTGKVDTLPALIPLGPFLDPYMAMYIYLTRNSARTQFVFRPDDKQWSSSSADIVAFTCKISGLPQKIFKFQRAFRNLFLNRVLINEDYRSNAVRIVGTLTRNNAQTISEHYAKWGHLYHQQNSSRVCPYSEWKFPEVRGEKGDSVTKAVWTEAVEYCDKEFLPPKVATNQGNMSKYWEDYEFTPAEDIEEGTLERKGEVLSTEKYEYYTGEVHSSCPGVNYAEKIHNRAPSKSDLDVLYPLERKPTYSMFIGIDTSPKGMALTALNVATKSHDVYYWSPKALDMPEAAISLYGKRKKLIGILKLHHIEFKWKSFEESERKLILSVAEKVVEIVKDFPPGKVRVGVERPLVPSNTIDPVQTQFTLEAIRAISSVVPGVETVDNNLVKKFWITGKKKVNGVGIKAKMYLQWLELGLPILASSIEDYSQASSREWEKSFEHQNHPVSDIVDSFALLKYLVELDVNGAQSLDELADRTKYTSKDVGDKNGAPVLFSLFVGSDDWNHLSGLMGHESMKLEAPNLVTRKEESTGITMFPRIEGEPPPLDVHDSGIKRFVFAKRYNESDEAGESRRDKEYAQYLSTPPAKDWIDEKNRTLHLSKETEGKFRGKDLELIIEKSHNTLLTGVKLLSKRGDDVHLTDRAFYFVPRLHEDIKARGSRREKEQTVYEGGGSGPVEVVVPRNWPVVTPGGGRLGKPVRKLRKPKKNIPVTQSDVLEHQSGLLEGDPSPPGREKTLSSAIQVALQSEDNAIKESVASGTPSSTHSGRPIRKKKPTWRTA